MKKAMAALWLFSACALADTTTFICTDAAGKKSLQDRPCPSTAQAAEARATKTNPKPLFAVPDTSATTKGIWCNHWKNNVGHHADQSNVGTDNRQRAYHRDQMIANQNRYKRECQ